MKRYSVTQKDISDIRGWIKAEEIGIPEIQRPFVWSPKKVKELIDSLYQGYPIGYIIICNNPNVRLKSGESSIGRKIIIDGQQRITALMASLLGHKVVAKDYAKKPIIISFHPFREEFAVQTPAIRNSSEWIHDISMFFTDNVSDYDFLQAYEASNPDTDKSKLLERIKQLREILDKPVGVIELSYDLDIEIITEIFSRINSKAVRLSQADFVMSTIASNKEVGINLRKLIDYFCHLVVVPTIYEDIQKNDSEFSNTPLFSKISWLKKNKDDLYAPTYKDMLRTAFTKEFKRGKFSDLVSLLAGRDFEKKTFNPEISKNSFSQLESGLLDFASETNFKRFVVIIKSTGFIAREMVSSINVLNFSYSLYLLLKEQGLASEEIEFYVRKWFVMSSLTQRYSGSVETKFDEDIKAISNKGIMENLEAIESSRLSDAFWDFQLVDNLEQASINNPYIKTFFAAQVKNGDKGLFSNDVTVENLIKIKGDVHHVFPKEYIKEKRNDKSAYNQIANYAYTQEEINRKIGKNPPNKYFKEILDSSKSGESCYGVSLPSEASFYDNLKQNCIPEGVLTMSLDDYDAFLEQRRKLMAHKIRDYYRSL